MDARYRLAPMREVRTREERLRRGDLAGAVGDAQAVAAELAAARGTVERAREVLAAARATRDRLLVHGAAGGTLAHVERYLRRLWRDLEAARGELVRADARHRGELERVDAARGQLAHARAEREIVDRHFAAWRAERSKLVERRED